MKKNRVLPLVTSAAFDPTKFNECAAHDTNNTYSDVCLT